MKGFSKNACLFPCPVLYYRLYESLITVSKGGISDGNRAEDRSRRGLKYRPQTKTERISKKQTSLQKNLMVFAGGLFYCCIKYTLPIFTVLV